MMIKYNITNNNMPYILQSLKIFIFSNIQYGKEIILPGINKIHHTDR
jgi:hypothetical protein